MKKIFAALLTILSISNSSCMAFETKVVRHGELEFWTDSFGNKENPAILLICGSGNQSITWHQEFCQNLADSGFFVIRYDNRDVGLSSVINYKKNPYTLLDMSKDAIVILDAYEIESAHIVGHSMGGNIALILAEHFPSRVSTITLLASTLDLRANLDSILQRPTLSKLSKPRKDFLDWVKTYISNPPKTLNDRIEKFIEGGRMQNGSKFEYDVELNRQIALQSFIRTKDAGSMFNHISAIDASYELYSKAAQKIKAPTLIIHGDQDPILPVDHAHALNEKIPNSKLNIIQGIGHGLNKGMYPILIENIIEISRKAKASSSKL